MFIVTAFGLLAEAARRTEDFSSRMIGLLYKDQDELPALLRMSFGDPTLANADPPVHTQQKQMIFPKFVAKRMAIIEDYLANFTAERIEHVRGLKTFDFMDEIGSAVPIRAISELIGFRDSRDDMLRDTAYASVEMTGATKTLEEIGQVRMRMDEIQAWMGAQLDERSGEASEDILDAVRVAMNGGKLARDEALITMITLLAAGGESTSSLLGNAVRMLAERPQLRQTLQERPDLLAPFVEELGRLESPFQHHLRSTPRNTELGGVRIPEGSAVLLMWGRRTAIPRSSRTRPTSILAEASSMSCSVAAFISA